MDSGSPLPGYGLNVTRWERDHRKWSLQPGDNGAGWKAWPKVNGHLQGPAVCGDTLDALAESIAGETR